ncbi:MAG TPA: FtsX-like permease family protein [Thermoanaerobaculia bacterium]
MELGPIFRAMMRHRPRFLLIVVEVALTLAIVANSVSLILEARSEMTRPSGFDEENLIYVSSTPFADAFKDPNYRRQSVDSDLRALRSLPGVKAASHTTVVPWSAATMSFGPRVAGTQKESPGSQVFFVDAAILETLGVGVARGRGFTKEEYDANPAEQPLNEYEGPVLITQTLADALFPDGDALGKVLENETGGGHFTIIGIVDRFYKPAGTPEFSQSATLFPIASASERSAGYLVRTETGKADAVAADVEKALLKADDGRNVRVRTIAELRTRFHTEDRLLVAALNGVMVLLVLVTALGIVGLTSFSVAERRRQIGTRRALGATKAAILRHFLIENWLVTTVGIALGLALAYALNYGLIIWIEGTRLDWRVLAVGVAFLWTLGIASALGPALRAARVPPAIATRNV